MNNLSPVLSKLSLALAARPLANSSATALAHSYNMLIAWRDEYGLHIIDASEAPSKTTNKHISFANSACYEEKLKGLANG